MDRAEQERRWYRARATWEVAKLCSDQGFFSECVTLYHDACYQAMWIALGDPPAGVWRHGGLINAFCRGHWQTPSALPQGLAPLRKKLNRLYVYRIRSDYEARQLSQEEAQEALDTTEEVLRLVAQHTDLRFP
jgi:hypothetical protein